MIARTTAALTAALVMVAGPLAAQQHGRGQGTMHEQGQGAMMGPGHAVAAFSPERLLEQRTELALTETQIGRLEQLRSETAARVDQAMASHEKHRAEMAALLASDAPDPQMVRAHFQGAHDSMGTAHWAEMQAALEARALLTEEQRAKVKAAMPEGQMHMRGRH